MKKGYNRRNITIGAIIGIALIVVAVVLLLVFQAGAFRLNVTYTVENALIEKEWQTEFRIRTTGEHSITFDVSGSGFITAVSILNENGTVVYRILNEEFSFTIGKHLDRGKYTLSLTYLMDFDDVERYLASSDMPYEIIPEDVQMLEEAFGRENTDYSGTFSIRIK
jgi:hypothetical protein